MEESTEICKAQVKDFFEMQRSKKHPPPEEKIDPVKAKRTLAALKKPPPSPPKTNYERIIERSYIEPERSGSTCSDRRLAERQVGKKFAQLGEQANQSCPPLKVSSDIVANHPGLVPGTNLGDYLGDDVHFDTMEVDEFRYQYGKPLVKDGSPPLTTMMRRFYELYMETCSKSGKDALTMRIKGEHDFVGQDLITIDFDEFFPVLQSKGPRQITRGLLLSVSTTLCN